MCFTWLWASLLLKGYVSVDRTTVWNISEAFILITYGNYGFVLLSGYLSFHMQDGFVTGSDAETELGESTKNFASKEILFLNYIYVGPFRNFMQYFPLMSNFQWAMYIIQFLLDVETYISHFKKILFFFFPGTKKPCLILIFDSIWRLKSELGFCVLQYIAILWNDGFCFKELTVLRGRWESQLISDVGRSAVLKVSEPFQLLMS